MFPGGLDFGPGQYYGSGPLTVTRTRLASVTWECSLGSAFVKPSRTLLRGNI